MKTFFATAAALTVATPALAHHPLNGMPMETFVHGVLSGVGHPVLGFDHLFFVLLVGVAALFTGRALLSPAFYIVGMLAGCVLTISGIALPIVELVIVASLLVLGYLVASGRGLNMGLAAVVFGGFGLFHGSAFAGSIVGQEGGASMAVIAGYLIGLGVVQYLLAIAAGAAMKYFWFTEESNEMAPRLAGATVAGVGLFLALEAVEGPILAGLGLGG
jgi:urease accessory protein